MAKEQLLNSKVAQAELKRAYVGCGKSGKKKRRVLVELAARDGKHCHWCSGSVRWAWDKGMSHDALNAASFDHIKTDKAGGAYSLGNGVLACRRCNNIRGDMKYSTFKKKLKLKCIEEWTKEYYLDVEQKKAKVVRQKMHSDRRKEVNRRKQVAREEWVARAHKRRWYHWAVLELQEWLQVPMQIGVVF